MRFWVLLVLLCFLSNKCEVGEQEEDLVNQFSCSFTKTDTLIFGTVDLSQNFSKTNIAFNAEVEKSDCPQVQRGDTATGVLDVVSRSGDTLTYKQTFNGSQSTSTSTIEGLNIVKTNSSATIVSGCILSLTSSGVIDNTAKEIRFTSVSSFKGDACQESSFYPKTDGLTL